MNGLLVFAFFQAVYDIQECQTLRCILSVILAMGNFLNSSESYGFNPEYLDRLPEVKDTKHKHSLLHHVCSTVLELFPDSSGRSHRPSGHLNPILAI